MANICIELNSRFVCALLFFEKKNTETNTRMTLHLSPLGAFLTSPDEYIFKALSSRIYIQGQQEFVQLHFSAPNFLHIVRVLQGTIYISQYSILFRPQDQLIGIFKIMLVDASKFEKNKIPKAKFNVNKNNKWASFSVSKITRMKVNGVSHNYEAMDSTTVFLEVDKDELQPTLDLINSLTEILHQKDEEQFMRVLLIFHFLLKTEFSIPLV